MGGIFIKFIFNIDNKLMKVNKK